MAGTIEIQPKCDDFYADNICYSIPHPTLRATILNWNDKRRLRRAMKSVKRLFKGNIPHIEEAYALELIECDGECYLRIKGVS